METNTQKLYAIRLDPWRTGVWTARVHLHMECFFNKYSVGPFSSWFLKSRIQPTMNPKQYFWSVGGSLRCEGPAVCTVLYPFTWGTLVSSEFGVPGRGGGHNQSPWGYWGMTIVTFGGRQKLYLDFQLHGEGWGMKKPTLLKGRLQDVEKSNVMILPTRAPFKEEKTI